MNCSEIEQAAAKLVSRLYLSPHRQEYPYHNLEHTMHVFDHVKEIALFYSLDEMQACALRLASWFHDTGQLHGEMEGHEKNSVLIMKNYLEKTGIHPDIIMEAESCILATKCGALPATLPEKIICDADTYHFGTMLFRETEFLIKSEMEMRMGKKILHWHQGSLALLKNHVFYTEYCQLALNAGKQKNIEWLQSLIDTEKLSAAEPD